MQDQHFLRMAGVAVPLFALRGACDDGTGTIGDLMPLIDWLDRWHQRVVQLLPLNEASPTEVSPYNAISAFALDPTYITTSAVPDVRESDSARDWLASTPVRRRVQRLRRSHRRHRRAVYALKMRVLEEGFAWFATQAAPDERRRRFERFCDEQSWWLEDYALFRALKERFDWSSWETWPDALRRRDPYALRQAAAGVRHRMQFARYVQWIATEQWDEMHAHARRRGVLVKGDLPFVCSRDSCDVWAHQDLFDLSSSAGAPPDAFSETGQAWGLPLYDWAAMRRSDYAWWRQRARQASDLYDLFRIDHLVGLYRTYAIPVRGGGTAGFVPAQEGEQLAQGRAVLSAIREEARGRAGVVAEDLGTVPDWVRESMTELGIPGYKIFRWETRDGAYLDPRSYPVLSLATTGTHDTDTLVLWWESLDEHDRRQVLRVLDGAGSLADPGQAENIVLDWTLALHLRFLQRLYEARSVLTILPIQDLFGWRDRINIPATVNGDNWTFRLPVAVEHLDQIAVLRERMECLRAMIDETGRNTLRRAGQLPE
jgi:4-alpha-glucanotransferase